tara:strand:- start:5837 stop:5986 length:150 start_codon:yes stop_codon:yes gene_type:complete
MWSKICNPINEDILIHFGEDIVDEDIIYVTGCPASYYHQSAYNLMLPNK